MHPCGSACGRQGVHAEHHRPAAWLEGAGKVAGGGVVGRDDEVPAGPTRPTAPAGGAFAAEVDQGRPVGAVRIVDLELHTEGSRALGNRERYGQVAATCLVVQGQLDIDLPGPSRLAGGNRAHRRPSWIRSPVASSKSTTLSKGIEN